MPVPVTMPELGEAVTSATIDRWLKAPGEAVTEGEPLLEILSDKVTAEIVAPASGVLSAIMASEGAEVAVGEEIAVIALAGEDNAPVALPASPPAPAPSATSPRVAAAEPEPVVAPAPVGEPSPAAAPVMAVSAPLATAIAEAEADPAGAGRRLYSPRVRHLVAEHGLAEAELAGLPGSGLGGRLTADDLLAHLPRRPAATGAPAAPAPVARLAPAIAPDADGDSLMPLTPMRRAIAAHMVRSVATAAHAWLAVEIDMSAVTRDRAAARAAFEATEGFGLTYLPFFAQAVVAALRAVPSLNATWEGDDLRPRPEVNLGVAVAVEGGLVVPVIAGADGLNLIGLARAIRDRAARARANRLTAADMAGGTCTVNNTGAFGSILSRPIINQPQVAIVTMEAIVRRPVVTAADAIAIRPLMNACLSYDGRAVDAPAAGAFLAAVKRRLETWPENGQER